MIGIASSHFRTRTHARTENRGHTEEETETRTHTGTPFDRLHKYLRARGDELIRSSCYCYSRLKEEANELERYKFSMATFVTLNTIAWNNWVSRAKYIFFQHELVDGFYVTFS